MKTSFSNIDLCFDEEKHNLSRSCALSKDEKNLHVHKLYGIKTCITSNNVKTILDLRKLITPLRYTLQFNHVFYDSALKHHKYFILMHKVSFGIKWFCISILLKVFFTFASGVTSYTILLTGYKNVNLSIFLKNASGVTGLPIPVTGYTFEKFGFL